MPPPNLKFRPQTPMMKKKGIKIKPQMVMKQSNSIQKGFDVEQQDGESQSTIFQQDKKTKLRRQNKSMSPITSSNKDKNKLLNLEGQGAGQREDKYENCSNTSQHKSNQSRNSAQKKNKLKPSKVNIKRKGTASTMPQGNDQSAFGKAEDKEQPKLTLMRQNTMTKDNYNFFVGDNEYRRDFFLRFQSKQLKQNYIKHLNQSSNHSLRCLMLALLVIQIVLTYFSSTGVVMHIRGHVIAMIFFSLAFYASTYSFENKLKNVNHGRFLKIILVNSQQFLVGLTSLQLYQDWRTESLVSSSLGKIADPSFQSTFVLICICMIHHVTALIANSLILPDWGEFTLAMTVLNLCLANFLFASRHFEAQSLADRVEEGAQQGVMGGEVAIMAFEFFLNCLKCQLVTTVFFSLQEKTRKELFVVSSTNSKTKKQLMQFFDCILPTCLISKEGTLLLCNSGFEAFLRTRFDFKSQTPSNIFKIIASDAVSKEKLQRAIQKVYQSQQTAGGLFSKGRQAGSPTKHLRGELKQLDSKQKENDDASQLNSDQPKTEIIEIVFHKDDLQTGQINSSFKNQSLNDQQPNDELRVDKTDQTEENTSKRLYSDFPSDLDRGESYRTQTTSKQQQSYQASHNSYYEDYEAMRLHLSYVYFKNQKAIMINIESLTDEKAKNRLIQMHTNLVTKLVTQNQKKMEDLHKQLIISRHRDGLSEADPVTDQISSKLGELLGNQQMTLNMVQQLDYYFKYISDQKDVKMENYTLSQEIEYCLDGLTARIRDDRQFQINLQMSRMPKNVVGDISRFRMCFRTLLEFGIKYSVNNAMQVRCGVEYIIREKRKCLIQFALILRANQKFDISPIEEIFNLTASDGHEQEQEMGHHDGLSQDNLMSDISCKISNNYQKFMNFINEFGYGMIILSMMARQLMGEAFIKKIEGETYSDHEDKSNSADDVGRINVGFRLPFEPGANKDVQSNNYLIHTSIQEQKDGCKIINKTFMTPGPTKKRLSDSFNKNNLPGKDNKAQMMNQNDGDGLEEAKDKDPGPDLRHFGSRGGVQNEQNKPSEPKVGGVRTSLLCQAKEDKQGAQVFFDNNRKHTQTSEKLKGAEQIGHDGSMNLHTASIIEENSNNNEKDSNGQNQLKQFLVLTNQSDQNVIKQQFSFIDPVPMQNAPPNNFHNLIQRTNDNNAGMASDIQNSQGSQLSFAKKQNQVDDNDHAKSNQIQEKKMQKGKHANYGTKPRDPTSDYQPIQVPQSVLVDGFIPNLGNANPNTEDLDSEKRDKVNSLQMKKPYDVDQSSDPLGSMDVIDSLMISSEENNSLGFSQNSILRQTKDQQELLERIQRENSRLNHKMTLSKFMQRQIFNRFSELPSASKNKFNPQDEPEDNTDQVRPPEVVEPPPENRGPEAPPKEEVRLDPLTGRPLIQLPNVFLDDDELCLNLNQELTSAYRFGQYDAEVKYLKSVNKSSFLQLKDHQEEEPVPKQKKHHAAPANWNKNIVMNPPHTNMHYDCGDKLGQLKNIKESLQKIENQQQLFNRLQLNKVHINSNSTENSAVSQSREVGRNHGSLSQKSDHVQRTKQIMLIVEDNEFIQASTQQQLLTLGVDWEKAMDGQEALNIVERYLLQNKLFDIILMDLILPVLDGYTTSQEIRKLEQTYGVAEHDSQFICGFSAQRGLDVENKCFDSGMDDIMPKPLNIELLQRLLRDHDRRTLTKSVPSHSSHINHASPVAQKNVVRQQNQNNAPGSISPMVDSGNQQRNIYPMKNQENVNRLFSGLGAIQHDSRKQNGNTNTYYSVQNQPSDHINLENKNHEVNSQTQLDSSNIPCRHFDNVAPSSIGEEDKVSGD